MTDTTDAIREMEARLARYPASRYPVQHATVQFHLGVTLTNAGRVDEAEEALVTAVELFRQGRLRVEHAKGLNSLGAVLRMQGRLEEAALAFDRAQAGFSEEGLALEQGAALMNLGLVQQEKGDGAAVDSIDRARSLLDPARVPAQAAAAARELGQALVAAGDLERARHVLEEATALSRRARAPAEMGAAANALGVLHLAEGRVHDALDAFTTAAAAHPRSVRPEGYAMAKANLALAHERAGEHPRARLAARQALGAPAAAAPVREQASGVLERFGSGREDLPVVLDTEPRERWLGTVREELTRLADSTAEERLESCAAWVTGQLQRPHRAQDLAEAWLGALLELPPDAMERLAASTVEAVRRQDPELADRYRRETSSAMARFHVPQWMRLKDTFRRMEPTVGGDGAWG